MTLNCRPTYHAYWIIFLSLFLSSPDASAHGRTIFKEDGCIIEMGFFKAHFTAYQPITRNDEEFCNAIPDQQTETVFALHYLHNSLKDMPVDFRIIKDVNDIGRYVKWKDIEQLKGIERDTVFYQPPVIRPDAEFRAAYKFTEPGHYIGIFTTNHPTLDKTYHAVFPFQVGGYFNFGYIPFFVLLIILIELFYLYTNGNLASWFGKTGSD